MEAINRAAKASIEEAKTRTVERLNVLNKTIYANLKQHVGNPSKVYADFIWEIKCSDEQLKYSILDHFKHMGFEVELIGNPNSTLCIPSRNWTEIPIY